MFGCIIIEDLGITLLIELLHWDEDAIYGYSPEMNSHIPMLEKTLDLLKKAGLKIIVCFCGGSNAEGLCDNGNMYFLFRGNVQFETLPNGFSAIFLTLEDDTELTLLCPDNFNPDMTPTEMQDYLSEKASVLHKWAERTKYSIESGKSAGLNGCDFLDGEYFETTEEHGWKYAPHQRYEKAIAYMAKYFELPKQISGSNGKNYAYVLRGDNDSEFRFEDLVEVWYDFPFGKPEEHSMIMSGKSGVLFAYGHNQTYLADPDSILKIGNTEDF